MMMLLPDIRISISAKGEFLRVSAREVSQNQLNQLASAIVQGGSDRKSC